jgi:hypothetical protein
VGSMLRVVRFAFGVAACAFLALPPVTAPAGPHLARSRDKPLPAQANGAPGEPDLVRVESSTADYIIRASVFILGDMGTVGSLQLERNLDRNDSELVKTFRVSGRTKPELVRKGRDIGGEFKTVTSVPLAEAGGLDGSAGGDDPAGETYYTGVLEKNGVAKGEKVIFYPDHAISTKTDGTEKKIDGRFQSLLAGFEFFLDNPVRPGEVYESKFILDGYPYLFKCEAGEPEFLDSYRVKAYRIDVTTYDGLLKDKQGRPLVVKKRGGIRLWLCKDEPYKNMILKMKLQYKWYLSLIFDLKSTA